MSTQWETTSSKRNEPNFLTHWCERDWTWMRHRRSHLKIERARGKGHFDNAALLGSTSTLTGDLLWCERRGQSAGNGPVLWSVSSGSLRGCSSNVPWILHQQLLSGQGKLDVLIYEPDFLWIKKKSYNWNRITCLVLKYWWMAFFLLHVWTSLTIWITVCTWSKCLSPPHFGLFTTFSQKKKKKPEQDFSGSVKEPKNMLDALDVCRM